MSGVKLQFDQQNEIKVEVGFGVDLGLGRADEAFKAAKAAEFVLVADLCGVERRPEEIQGFVIRLQERRAA